MRWENNLIFFSHTNLSSMHSAAQTVKDPELPDQPFIVPPIMFSVPNQSGSRECY